MIFSLYTGPSALIIYIIFIYFQHSENAEIYYIIYYTILKCSYVLDGLGLRIVHRFFWNNIWAVLDFANCFYLRDTIVWRSCGGGIHRSTTTRAAKHTATQVLLHLCTHFYTCTHMDTITLAQTSTHKHTYLDSCLSTQPHILTIDNIAGHYIESAKEMQRK